jgi:vacuolar-type H+-ATPase subunit I/STV1
MKLTLNQAAKDCGRAKSTISKSIKSGKLSHEKGENGAFLIDPSELHRVFPKTGNEHNKGPLENIKSEQENSALQVEVYALRRELETANLERTREREQLTDQIQALRETLAEQRADFRQTLAVLSDQRAGQGTRRFFGLLPTKSG